MKFKQYILEQEDYTIEKITNDIRKHCGPFLKEVGRNKYYYRGIPGINKSFMEKTPRTDRRPMDTNTKWHRWINKFLYKKFGWKPRSEGVFATPNLFEAENYGVPFYIFPQGEIKYVWNPRIIDFYQDISSKINIDNIINPKDEFEKEDASIVMDKISLYTDKDLRKNNEYETIFKCEKYYLLNTIHYNIRDLTKLLWK